MKNKFDNYRSESALETIVSSCINYVIRKDGNILQLSAISEESKKPYTIYLYNLYGEKVDSISTTISSYYEMDEMLKREFDILCVLSCEVFRNSVFGDCSNKGITNYKNILMAFGDKIEGNTLAKEYTNLVQIMDRGGRKIAKPIDAKYASSMFGGCFIFTSNILFGYEYPIPVHDRVEGK